MRIVREVLMAFLDGSRFNYVMQESSSDPVAPTGLRIVATASVPEPVIMGSAAPAPMRDPSEDATPDRGDVAGYASTCSIRNSSEFLQSAKCLPPSVLQFRCKPLSNSKRRFLCTASHWFFPLFFS